MAHGRVMGMAHALLNYINTVHGINAQWFMAHSHGDDAWPMVQGLAGEPGEGAGTPTPDISKSRADTKSNKMSSFCVALSAKHAAYPSSQP